MKRRLLQIALIVLGLTAVSNSALAVVEADLLITRVQIREDADPSFVVDRALSVTCSQKTWFALDADSPFFKEMLATILMAYALNKTVKINFPTSHTCAFNNLAVYITQIQLGD